MKLVKQPQKPGAKDLRPKHYELRTCGGSVEKKHAKGKVGV